MNFLQSISEQAANLAANSLRTILMLVAIWMILGLLGWFRPHSIRYVARVLFPVGALVCLGVALMAGIFLAAGKRPR